MMQCMSPATLIFTSFSNHTQNPLILYNASHYPSLPRWWLSKSVLKSWKVYFYKFSEHFDLEPGLRIISGWVGSVRLPELRDQIWAQSPTWWVYGLLCSFGFALKILHLAVRTEWDGVNLCISLRHGIQLYCISCSLFQNPPEYHLRESTIKGQGRAQGSWQHLQLCFQSPGLGLSA